MTTKPAGLGLLLLVLAGSAPLASGCATQAVDGEPDTYGCAGEVGDSTQPADCAEEDVRRTPPAAAKTRR